MGIGTAVSLFQEGKVLNHMQKALGVWDFKLNQIKTTTEQIGLAWDWRTGMALVSAALFCVGCLVGLFDLWISN